MRYTRTTTVRGSMMLPTDRVQSTGREKLNLVERVERATDRIPFPQRIVPIIGAVLFLCPVLAPIAVVSKVRTKMATAYVAMLAAWIIYVFALYSADPATHPISGAVRWSLRALPVVVAVASHMRPMNRWYVPCRSAAPPPAARSDGPRRCRAAAARPPAGAFLAGTRRPSTARQRAASPRC